MFTRIKGETSYSIAAHTLQWVTVCVYDNHDQWTDAHERYNPAFQQSKSVTVLLERYGQGV